MTCSYSRQPRWPRELERGGWGLGGNVNNTELWWWGLKWPPNEPHWTTTNSKMNHYQLGVWEHFTKILLYGFSVTILLSPRPRHHLDFGWLSVQDEPHAVCMLRFQWDSTFCKYNFPCAKFSWNKNVPLWTRKHLDNWESNFFGCKFRVMF